MSDDQTPNPEPEVQRIEPPLTEQRSLGDVDPAIIGGLIAGAGAALGPPLAAITDHLLSGKSNPEPPAPKVELPPGVNTDN